MVNPVFIEIKEVWYLTGYQIRILFSDNTIKHVDLEKELDGEIFEPLKDLQYFRQFTIRFNTIEWPNGADFAPEYLYSIGKIEYPLSDSMVAEP